MRLLVMTLIFAVICGGAADAEIQKGSTVEVKAHSIWFPDLAKFDHWQNLKRSGNSAAASSYVGNAVAHREAWDFSIPQSVKILAYEPAKHRVKVEMKTPGRMLGSVWFLETDAIE
jgi:hypothetical protein